MTALAQRRDENDLVVDAINSLDQADLDGFSAWQWLADLSSATTFELIDAHPDSIVFKSNGKFEAIATVYITLVYGSRDDQEKMSDEYIATVRGHFGASGAEIDEVDVDTTPFFE